MLREPAEIERDIINAAIVLRNINLKSAEHLMLHGEKSKELISNGADALCEIIGLTMELEESKC